MKLALMDCGPFVVVEKLDRVLNRNDVASFGLIDMVKDDRQG